VKGEVMSQFSTGKDPLAELEPIARHVTGRRQK
jgi:hypothetical protein